ncbi:MAG: hypothetical protein HC769_22890 [Cyanobacteria bacterium CRU_2_1]|nr:hypothetical protein [Cyanobacteria bacterium CRU_2_1]
MSSFITQDLTEGRLQLHYAIQLIAATGAELAEPQPDYSHVSLNWNPDLRLFVGATIAAEQPFKVAIDPIALTVLILDETHTKRAELALHQKTITEGLNWLKGEIARRRVDADKVVFLSYPPDDFPDHAIAHGAPFDQHQIAARQVLADDYAKTYELLQEVVAITAAASPIHIWPHHFDMATLISLPEIADKQSRSIGIGFSPGDKSYDQPYWYVSPYPYPDTTRLPQLEGNGFWHTTDWVGAVLTTSRLQNYTVESAQIETFLHSALNASQCLMGINL